METQNDSKKIIIKRRKDKRNLTKTQKYNESCEDWIAYWRANPHRYITEYLGLRLYDFQKVIIYLMNFYSNFIFVASRGLAKSTISLLFALQRCGLYPDQKVVVVAPTKGQSSRFIKKVQEFMRASPNLRAEIADVKIGQNESRILFHNGSEIITVPYNENALGESCA